MNALRLRASPYGCAKSLGSSEKGATAVYGSAHAQASGRGSVRVSVNVNGRNGRVHDRGSASGPKPDDGAADMWTPARRRR